MWPSDPGINFTKKWITGGGGFSMTIFPALVKTYEQCSKPPVGLLDGVINCPVYIGGFSQSVENHPKTYGFSTIGNKTHNKIKL